MNAPLPKLTDDVCQCKPYRPCAACETVCHFEQEVFANCYSQPLCESQRELDCFTEGDPDAELTDDEAQVTCTACLVALGYDVAPDTMRVRVAA